MIKFKTRGLDFLEILPPSSPALKENIDSILDDSTRWTAAIEKLDPQTGTYRIVLQGTLSGLEKTN